MRSISSLLIGLLIVCSIQLQSIHAVCQSSDDCSGFPCIPINQQSINQSINQTMRCDCPSNSFESNGESSQLTIDQSICSNDLQSINSLFYSIYRFGLIGIWLLIGLLIAKLINSLRIIHSFNQSITNHYNFIAIVGLSIAITLKLVYLSIDPLRNRGLFSESSDFIWKFVTDLVAIVSFTCLFTHFKQQVLISPVISDRLYNHLVKARWIDGCLIVCLLSLLIGLLIAAFISTLIRIYTTLLATYLVVLIGLLIVKFYQVARDDRMAIRRVSVMFDGSIHSAIKTNQFNPQIHQSIKQFIKYSINHRSIIHSIEQFLVCTYSNRSIKPIIDADFID